MKVLQLLVIAVAYVVVVVEGAARFDAPLWLVSIAMIGPFVWWLYAPMFRRRPSDLREDSRGRPPSLLDLLLEQPPRTAIRARVRARVRALEAADRQPTGIPPVPRSGDENPAGNQRR